MTSAKGSSIITYLLLVMLVACTRVTPEPQPQNPYTTAITVTESAKLLASDRAPEDAFGIAVSLDGDTALIGARGDNENGFRSGSAYVFVRDGTSWTQQAKLVPSDGDTGDEFGFTVALSGDTALIGAHLNDDNGGNSGSAYVFVRSGTTWTQQVKLLPADSASGDEFGRSVSIDGDTALLGSHQDDDNGAGSGSAYVFVRSGTSWLQQAKLVPTDGDPGDEFGRSVSIAGDSVLIGTPFDNDGATHAGSAYVFTRSGTSWSEQAKLLASDPAAFDEIGRVVALDGDTALVGSHLNDENGSNSGSAYVFVRSGTSWSQQAELSASDGMAEDQLGIAVAIFGDTALVGSHLTDEAAINSGSVYLYTRSGSTWTQQAEISASDGATGDFFGFAVSLDGGTALIGALLDVDDGSRSGSVYVFDMAAPNQAPSADPNGPYLGTVDASIIFDGSGSNDPDDDPLTYHWDFGDGNSGSGVAPLHSYGAAEFYDVCLTVDDGTVYSAEACTLAVVFDPAGGFVTGGGWIDSPAGAYQPEPSLTGRVNVGFVSKYKNGASIPSGNTELQFQAGDLNFHSNSYRWLVIDQNNSARFEGVGSINGEPGYGFTLWATDGSPDTFRIKIWDDADTVIYDNLGSDLVGGNIVIHQGK